MAPRPADAMHPQLAQSGVPPNWHGVMPRLQVGRDGVRHPREDAVVGRGRRLGVDVDHPARHLDLGEGLAQGEQFGHHPRPILGPELFGRFLADLRRVEAEPDLPRVRLLRPERRELTQVPVALHDLAGHRAMHHDPLPDDVLQDAIVGGGRAAHVVLGRQPVDRHDQREPRNRRPGLRDRAHGARDDLHVEPHRRQLRQEHVELAETDEGLAADEGEVHRAVPGDERQDAVDRAPGP